MKNKLILILLLGLACPNMHASKSSPNLASKAIGFAIDIDLPPAFMSAFFTELARGDDSQTVKESYIKAISKLSARGAYNVLFTMAERVGIMASSDILNDSEVDFSPDNKKALIRESIQCARGSSISELGYNKIIIHLAGYKNYQDSIKKFKEAIKEYYFEYLQSRHFDWKEEAFIKVFDTYNPKTPEGLIDIICKRIDQLSDYWDILDAKEFRNSLIIHLSKSDQSFQKIIEPHINKKKLAAIMLSGSIAGIAANYLLLDLFSSTNTTVVRIIRDKFLPVHKNNSGSYLWKYLFGAKESKVVGTQNGVIALVLMHKLYYEYQLMKKKNKSYILQKSSDESIYGYMWRMVAITWLLYDILPKIYSSIDDLAVQFHIKDKLKKRFDPIKKWMLSRLHLYKETEELESSDEVLPQISTSIV